MAGSSGTPGRDWARAGDKPPAAKKRPPIVQSGPLRHKLGSSASGIRTREPELLMTSSTSSPRVSGAKSKMNYSETRGDLFSCPAGASLAHCVSEDMALGKGIAKEFKKRFGGLHDLKAQGIKTGGVAILEREDRCIFNLVTKLCYFNKPTYDTMHRSLCSLREQCISRGITKLCMPRIGCGLDGLDWDRVKGMIQEIFSDCEISITIYTL